jgi:hypothetical protein
MLASGLIVLFVLMPLRQLRLCTSPEMPRPASGKQGLVNRLVNIRSDRLTDNSNWIIRFQR